MFALEQAWKDESPQARFDLRQQKLRPLLEQYWALLDSFEAAEGTALSKAKNYSLNQKDALNAVLLDGRLELTNNLAERTVKPFVMARKNFLFCDTAKGADASALCFSVRLQAFSSVYADNGRYQFSSHGPKNFWHE